MSRKLRGKQLQALEALLDGQLAVDVMAELGVSRTTLWRWKRSQAWRAAWAEAQEERVHSASDKLLAAADEAVEYLRTAVDPTRASYKRVSLQGVRAAQLLLERGDIRRLEPRQEHAVEVNEDRVRALLMRLPLGLLREVVTTRSS